VSLKLTVEQLENICEHGAGQFPHECCAFLLRTARNGSKAAQRLLPADNARGDEARRNRFLITPEVYQSGERVARAAGLDVLGFYHSHPDAPARPSQYALDHAWPWYSYVIVATSRSGAGDVTSWVLEDDRSRFVPEPIEAGAEPITTGVGG